MYSFNKDTSRVGTLAASPLILPSRCGSTFPTAFAAPVVLGTMLNGPDRCKNKYTNIKYTGTSYVYHVKISDGRNGAFKRQELHSEKCRLKSRTSEYILHCMYSLYTLSLQTFKIVIIYYVVPLWVSSK